MRVARRRWLGGVFALPGCLGLLTLFVALQVHFLAHRIDGVLRTGAGHSSLCRRTVAHRHALTRRRSRRGTIQAFFFLRLRLARCQDCSRFEGQQAQQDHGQGRVFIGGQTQIGAPVQAQAVEQLGFIGGQNGCERGNPRGIGVGVLVSTRADLAHRHALQHARHVFQGRGGAQSMRAQHFAQGADCRTIALRQRVDELEHIGLVHAAEHLAHHGLIQPPRTKGNRLVGQAQRIAHGAARRARQQTQGPGVCRNPLGGQNRLQMFTYGLGRHRAQAELQAAREHRDRHLLRVGGGQHKFEIVRRLFQGLEHGVERMAGEHVHLVDHEDLEAPLHRLVDRLLQQGLHLVDAAVGGGIELGVIHKAPAVDVHTGLAHTAGRGGDTALPVGTHAVERFGQYPCHGSLAHATRAGEQISVVQTPG